MHSLFFKHFFRSALLLMVSMVALAVSFIMGASQVLGNTERERVDNALVAITNYLDYASQSDASRDDIFSWKPESEAALAAIAAIGDMHVIITDPRGEIKLASAHADTHILKGTYISPEALALCESDVPVPAEFLRGLPFENQGAVSRCLYTADRTQVVGYILISSYVSNYRALMQDFMQSWLFMSLLILFASGLLAYVIARRMVSPLRQMSHCARSFAHGDFTARVDTAEQHDRETRELAYSFNAMADALQNGEELRRSFIGNISHELKTPMTTIAGFIGGILDGTIPEEKRSATLELIRDEVMRLSRLVVSMTNLTRLQTGQLDLCARPFDISEMAVRTLLGLESRINAKNLNVDLDISESGPLLVMADPDSIIQVLTNLLDNAVKFSDPGTNLQMRVYAHGNKAHISIANAGPTIPPEDLPYIFDRFYKADRSRSHDRTGMGLGLFLVRSILYAHNEDIHVSSEEGRTEFSFTLTQSKAKKLKN